MPATLLDQYYYHHFIEEQSDFKSVHKFPNNIQILGRRFNTWADSTVHITLHTMPDCLLGRVNVEEHYVGRERI